VPVNDIDVKRLLKATGKRVDEVVRLYDGTEITFPPGREGWIRLSYGKRILGLKKKHGHCLFLGDDKHCLMYAARPVTCRTYPLLIKYDQAGKLVDMEMLKRVQCQSVFGKKQSLKKMIDVARQEDAEDRKYYDRLKKWNNKKKPGKAGDFYRFLGLI
jgi:Fe-S-cluster containining protein